MYKIMNIGGDEYRLEFSVEASLYADCTAKLMEFLGAAYGSGEIAKNVSKVQPEKQAEAIRVAIKEGLQSVANIPDVAMTLFYAGLLEYHGIDGDQRVKSMRDAKRLVRAYFAEHEDDDQGDFYALLQLCIEQMGEDGFFKRIGLEKMFGNQKGSNKPVPIRKKNSESSKA